MRDDKEHVYPITAQARFHYLDVIRGLALLGILLANMSAFSQPVIYSELLNIELWSTSIDHFAATMVDWIVQGKFYTTFSFLFGVGFMIFLSKAEAKGYSPQFLFTKRVSVLLVFGLIHATLIWWGDILVTYAVCGFLLMLFYRMNARKVFIWAISLWGIIIFLNTALTLVQVYMESSYSEFISDLDGEYRILYEQAFMIYGEGSWSSIITRNIADWNFMVANMLIFAPFVILPMFLLGVYAYKRGIIQEPQQHLPWLRKLWLTSLVLGVVFSIIKYAYSSMDATSAGIGSFIGETIGDASLSICYITTVVLLYLQGKASSLFNALAWAGRMALTNYIMQSIVCTVLFYNFGFGLYGQVGAASCVLIALILFGIQLYTSRWWLTRYQWGPAEWLWRKLTYGSLQPQEKRDSSS